MATQNLKTPNTTKKRNKTLMPPRLDSSVNLMQITEIDAGYKNSMSIAQDLRPDDFNGSKHLTNSSLKRIKKSDLRSTDCLP